VNVCYSSLTRPIVAENSRILFLLIPRDRIEIPFIGRIRTVPEQLHLETGVALNDLVVAEQLNGLVCVFGHGHVGCVGVPFVCAGERVTVA
jgi:hypothetical protein